MRIRLVIAEGRIEGSGADRSGPFEMRGTYEETNRVRILKRYPWLDVNYNGLWDGQVIFGTWTIISAHFFDTGTFELWPESAEASLGEFVEEEQTEPRAQSPCEVAPKTRQSVG